MNFISKPIISWLNRERPPREFPLSDYERIRYELKQCDVLLVEGRTRVSEVIRMITHSPWTHAALYIGRFHDIEDPDLRTIIANYYDGAPEDQLVIESLLGQGTIIRALDRYSQDHLRICRPGGLSYQDCKEVTRFAISRLGYDYDIRHIFDLARFLFPWFILPRKWRSSLFTRSPGHSTRTVCSTMIAEAFGFVQFPILPLVKRSDGDDGKVHLYRRNPKLFTPSDFDYSPYFEIIKYPFLDFTTHASYRLLPWQGKGTLTDEESESYLDESDHSIHEQVDQAIEQAVKNTPKSGQEEDGQRESGDADETVEPTDPGPSAPQETSEEHTDDQDPGTDNSEEGSGQKDPGGSTTSL